MSRAAGQQDAVALRWSRRAWSQPILTMSMVPMSVCEAAHDGGARATARARGWRSESTLLFIPATTACWRRARLKSPSHLRTRENSSACGAVELDLPGREAHRPPGLVGAVDEGARVGDRHAAERVDHLREAVELDDHDVVDRERRSGA